MAHPDKITAAFEFPALTLTVPGLRAKNFKIVCALSSCAILIDLNCRF
ncbi:MAG: hypothetical protein ACK5Y6_10610 [Pseudomonadota bacterium]